MPPKSNDDSGNIIDTILKFFGRSRKPEKTPVPGFGTRLKHAFKYSWRGIFGFLLPIIYIPIFWEKDVDTRKVELMWYTMVWFFIVRPVNVPVTALIPIFVLPMTGVYSTALTCSCFMSENITLYLLGGILILLLNNSGLDRRIALSIMAAGDDATHFTAKRLVYKCSLAAFLLSFLSSRMLASAVITEYFTQTMTRMETTFAKTNSESSMREIRYVVNNAIQTSASIGGTALIHSGPAVVAFRSIFCERGIAFKDKEYPDIFNYLQYSAFAFPLAVVTYMANYLYYSIIVPKTEMTVACREGIQKKLRDFQNQLPSDITLHEKLTVLFLMITLFFLFYRWSDWLGGWSTFQQSATLSYRNVPLPAIRDATVAAIFVVLLHTLPMSFNFFKYFTATKKSELPPLKAESAILWWRFSDKNLNYSYFFLIGSGNALIVATIKTGLSAIICENSGTLITNNSWNIALLIVIVVGAVAGSIMPETAGLVVFLPFVLALADGQDPWSTHIYLPALAVGIVCNYGFLYPFRYSPAHNCHYIGKTPIKKMICQGLGSTIISVIILWLAIAFVAPHMWDPSNEGIPPCSAAEEPPPAE